MLETRFEFTKTDTKTIERLIDDEHVAINHMVLNKGESLPRHNANSNVYMIVTRGTISLQLGDQEERKYENGSILNIPYNTPMNVYNSDEDTLEFFVVKSPSPKTYAKMLRDKR